MDAEGKKIAIVFNQFYSELGELYHQYAKNHALSEAAFWLLYALHEDGAAYTQSELCSDWHWTPQTVNTALKNLERQGYIALEPSPGNQKNKMIRLTQMGKVTVDEVIAPLVQAEEGAFARFSRKEQTMLYQLTRKYIDSLRKELTQL